MKRSIILSICHCMLFLAGYSASAQGEADTVVNRYRQYLFRTLKPDVASIKVWTDSLRAKQWPDINYQDTEKASWQVLKHLLRVRYLAAAWAIPQSPYHHNEAVGHTLDSALSHWLEKRYKNSNWWHNEIGVPQHMRDIIVLLRDKLTPEQFRQSMEVLKQHRVQGNGAGANLIWSADLGLHYGALANDRTLMERCRDLMLNEIGISKGDGIQPDFSFHQHDKRLQVFQYGKAFLLDNVRVAWELRGTPWAFPQEKVNLLTDFIFKGWQWMARGIHTVPGTMDRSSSRENELRSPDIRYLVPFLTELCPDRIEALNTFAAWQNGEPVLTGLRHWPYSDFTAYHRHDFSFFVKTISARTLPTESINNENLKGNLLNNGDAYLVRDGQEYFNLMPVWNWSRIPGVTGFADGAVIGRQPFAGNVNNGSSGLTAMDYTLADKEQQQQFSAHKFWAAHGDVVVCLITDLRARVRGDVSTTLDQCRWRGDVTVNKPGNVLKEGMHELGTVKWVHHAGFAYIPIPLFKATLALQLGKVTGSWQSINRSQSSLPVTENIFMPVLNHGHLLQGEAAGYVLAHCPTAAQAAKLADKPSWHVVRNSKDCQTVLFEDGTLMASFFNPHQLLFKSFTLEVDRPCLILISNNKMYASDPLHQGGTVRVKWNSTVRNIELPADGTSVTAGNVSSPLTGR